MKTIYINTAIEKVFYSIDELKQDKDFVAEFVEYFCESKQIIDNLNSLFTYENIRNFCDNSEDIWMTYSTNKDTVYVDMWNNIVSDNLEDFISQLRQDEMYEEVLSNYDSLKELFNDIKNDCDTYNDFIFYNFLDGNPRYTTINLKENK